MKTLILLTVCLLFAACGKSGGSSGSSNTAAAPVGEVAATPLFSVFAPGLGFKTVWSNNTVTLSDTTQKILDMAPKATVYGLGNSDYSQSISYLKSFVEQHKGTLPECWFTTSGSGCAVPN
jgi:hypothetical protein